MSSNPMDLTGRIFGRLTVTAPGSQLTERGSVVWLVRCSCGRNEQRSQRTLFEGGEKQRCHECATRTRKPEQQGVDHNTPCGARHADGGASCAKCQEIVAGLASVYERGATPGPACKWAPECEQRVEENKDGEPTECKACKRQGLRIGRDEDGRPIRARTHGPLTHGPEKPARGALLAEVRAMVAHQRAAVSRRGRAS